jgi:hypothetical protein
MRTALAALILAFSALAALPAAANTGNLLAAVMVEWTVANCQPARIPAVLVEMSSMVIDSAPAAEVEAIRAAMRKGTATQYSDKAAACADMVERMKQGR